MYNNLFDFPFVAVQALPAVAKVVKKTDFKDPDVLQWACKLFTRAAESQDKFPRMGDAELARVRSGVKLLLDALLAYLSREFDPATMKEVLKVLGNKAFTLSEVGHVWTRSIVDDLKSVLKQQRADTSVATHAINVLTLALEQNHDLVVPVKQVFLDLVTGIGRQHHEHVYTQGLILRLFFKLHQVAPGMTPITPEVMAQALGVIRRASVDDNSSTLAANCARLLLNGGDKLLARPDCVELALLTLKHACDPAFPDFTFGRTSAIDALKQVFSTVTHTEAGIGIGELNAAAAVFPFDYGWHVTVRQLVDYLKAAREAAPKASQSQDPAQGPAQHSAEQGPSGKRLRTEDPAEGLVVLV